MKICQSSTNKDDRKLELGNLYQYKPKNIEKCFAGDLYLAVNTPKGSDIYIMLVSVERGSIWSTETVWGYSPDDFIDVTNEYCLTPVS